MIPEFFFVLSVRDHLTYLHCSMSVTYYLPHLMIYPFFQFCFFSNPPVDITVQKVKNSFVLPSSTENNI